MAHFAMICPPFYSHLRVFEALGHALVSRGHKISFIMPAGGADLVEPDARASVSILELPRDAVAPPLAGRLTKAARPFGFLGLLSTIADAARLTDQLCAGAPLLIERFGCDAIIGDQMEPAAGLVAEALGLPLVSVAAALPVHRDETVPLPFLGWSYNPNPWGIQRNQGGETVARLVLRAQGQTIMRWCRRFGLPVRDSLSDCLSTRAQISQLIPELDFPRKPSSLIRMVGPIRREGQDPDDGAGLPEGVGESGKPLVYVSLGTLQGHRASLLRTIARAGHDAGAETLVVHCGQLSSKKARSLEADHVAGFVDQRAVLAHSAVCVTHAGMNTTLDSLSAGVPLLALPIAFDQPGIAARIVHHGLGLRRSRVLLSRSAARSSLERLLNEATFGTRAKAIGSALSRSGGAGLAADIVESATGTMISKKKAVAGLVA